MFVKTQLALLLDLSNQLAALEAVPALRAAQILCVKRRTVYRLIERNELETVPRDGKAWVTARSLFAYLQSHYIPTDQFNVFDDWWRVHAEPQKQCQS